MTPLLAGLAGALIVAGGWGLVFGLQRRPVVVGRPPSPRRRRGPVAWWASLGRGLQVGLVAATLVGVVVGVTTGWVLAVVLLPAVVLGLPYLLMQDTSKAEIARLEAMAEWTRNLAGVLTVGVNLEQALMVSLRSTPTAIKPEVTRLVARLEARWPVDDALRGFAADLADATGDLMVMELQLGARSRGAGLASVLTAVAESTAAEVAARRAIEADRAKPRATARWVTILATGALTLFSLTGRFLEPYHSPAGQLVLAILLTCYALVLVKLRRMSTGTPLPRLLNPEAGG